MWSSMALWSGLCLSQDQDPLNTENFLVRAFLISEKYCEGFITIHP